MGQPRRSFWRLPLRWLRWLPVLLLLMILPGLPLTEAEAQERGSWRAVAHHVEQPPAAPLPQPDGGAEAVSAGWFYTCVLLRNGEVLCYQPGTWEQRAVPADLGPVSQISAGFNHACALTNSGTVRCWGSNGYGEADVPPDLGPVSQVSAGTQGTCVLLTDGTVRCWGIPVTYQPDVPSDLGPVRQISANVTVNGSGATCVVTNAGTVRCWGNVLELEEIFIPTDLGPVNQISTGGDHACTVNAQGQVRCWPTDSSTPPDDLGAVQQVSAGFGHTCAVTTDGKVRCWGSNHNGQADVPPDLGPVSQVSAGFQHTCAVTTNGAVRCWGGSSPRQLVPGIEERLPIGDAGQAGKSVSPASTDTIGQIAFVSDRDGNSEIYVMNADGSNQTRLTHNQAYDTNPTWSPDGRRIAFVSNRDGNEEIYVMDADGRNQIRLTYTTGSNSPAWSPDGHRIAFSQYGDSGGIYVMDADGTNQTRLFSDSAFALAWSPDGRRITFSGDGCGNPDHDSCFYVIDIDGNNKTRLPTVTRGVIQVPVWSPDSSQVAYTVSGVGASVWYRMHIINADGRGQPLEVGDGIPFAWTPDGTQIIGVCDWGPGNEICIADIELLESTRLTNVLERHGSANNPSLSLDGNYIAFEVYSSYDDIAGVYVVNRDGTGQTRLADGKNPVWRPAVIQEDKEQSSTLSTVLSYGTAQPLPVPDTPSAIVPSGLVYSAGRRQYLVDLTNNLSVPFYPAPPRGSIRGPGDTWLWIEMSENIGSSSWFRIVQAQRDSTDLKILLESTTFSRQFPGYVSPIFWHYGGIFLPELVLSADATRVFFIACLEGMGEATLCNFFELDLATRHVSMVTEFAGDIYPAWINPDGQRAIYTWDVACMGSLHVRRERTALSGTPFSAVWLADKRFVYSRHICNGAWTPLDQQVEPQFDIILASANGSDERVVVPGMVASSMAIAPDQQTLAFIPARPGVKPAGDVALWVVNLDGSGLRKVLDLPDDVVDLRWEVPTEEQQRRLAVPPPLPTQGEIAYVHEGNIYLLDLARWQTTPLVTDGTVGLVGSYQNTQMAWSPDGKRLAYASNRAGNYDIYVLDVESGAVEQITTDPRDEFLPSFAPDGTLFFVRIIDPYEGGGLDAYGENNVIRVTRSGEEEVVAVLPCEQFSLNIDANGLLAVAYGCNLMRGSVSIVDTNAPTDDLANTANVFDGVCSGVRAYSASDIKWSHDGATLAIIGADCLRDHRSGHYQAIFLVDPTQPEMAPRRILSDQGWLRALDWSPDDEWIVYANSPISERGLDVGIWIVNIEDGRPYHVVPGGHNPAWRPIPPNRWWPLSPLPSYIALALGLLVLGAGGIAVGWAGVAWMSSSRGGRTQGGRTAHVGTTRRLSSVSPTLPIGGGSGMPPTQRMRGNGGPRRWYWLIALIGVAVVLVLIVFRIGWPFGDTADKEGAEPVAAGEPTTDTPETLNTLSIATDPTPAFATAEPIILSPPTATPPPPAPIPSPDAAGPIILPPPTVAPPPTPAVMVEVPAPRLMSRSAWGAHDARSGMLQHTPARIIVSHDTHACCTDVTPATRMRQNQSRHMDNMGWPDIAYHYSIAPDGTILTGRAVEIQSDSAYAPVNPTYQINGSIVLGILGNYDQQHPTAESLRALTWLMAWLCQRYGIAPNEIFYLRQVAPVDPWRGETTSPGRNMPDVAELRDAVRAILVGERQP